MLGTYNISFVGDFPVLIFVVRVSEAKVVTAGEAFCPHELIIVDVHVFHKLQLLNTTMIRQYFSF